MKTALVTGAGGFIGGHLVKRLLREGYSVRAVDWKPFVEWHSRDGGSRVENFPLRDLRNFHDCIEAVECVNEVYNLAADMGGMGFITNNKLDCMLSVLINTHLLQAAAAAGVQKYFFSSSACVYPAELQNNEDIEYWGKKGGYWGLRESDAYPADPEDGYGWEKLFSERMCRHFYEDRGMEVRIARYHNVYGPHGTYKDGREKAPAAICRKVATAVLTGTHNIEVWGDGAQTRSFMYIDDCIDGTLKLMDSTWVDPLNIGSSELVSINKLVDIVVEIAGMKSYTVNYVDGPQGVRGRNSDNTLIKNVLGWEPSISLVDGLDKTYKWVYDQVKRDF